MKKRIIKLTLSFIGLLILASSCIEEIDYDKKYIEEFPQYQKDSIDIIKKQFEHLLSFSDKISKIEDLFEPAEHKDISISLSQGESEYDTYTIFNTLQIDQTFFESDYSHDFPLTSYGPLYNLRRFINREEMNYGVFTETGRARYNRFLFFKSYCEQFANLEYIIIQTALEAKLPTIVDYENFTTGTYSGAFLLFNFKTGELLDNFFYQAQNSDDFLVAQSEDSEVQLYKDYFKNINEAITNEMNARYDFSGNAVKQGKGSAAAHFDSYNFY